MPIRCLRSRGLGARKWRRLTPICYTSSMNFPKHCPEPYGQLSSRAKAAMQHDYFDAEGQLLWSIVRYAGARGDLKERSFVPA